MMVYRFKGTDVPCCRLKRRHLPIFDYSRWCWLAFCFNPILGILALITNRKGLVLLMQGRQGAADRYYLVTFSLIAVSIVTSVCFFTIALGDLVLTEGRNGVSLPRDEDASRMRLCQHHMQQEFKMTVEAERCQEVLVKVQRERVIGRIPNFLT